MLEEYTLGQIRHCDRPSGSLMKLVQTWLLAFDFDDDGFEHCTSTKHSAGLGDGLDFGSLDELLGGR